MRKALGFVWLAASLLNVACSAEMADTASEDTSELHFIEVGQGYAGLVAKLKKDKLQACTRGIGQSQEWSDNIKKATLQWIKPLRALTTEPLAGDVDVTADGRSGCDFFVTAANGVHANTQLNREPVVNMSASGYFGSFNVLLHEFGHAFALSDTYVGGQSGRCAPGQPQAVMCNTSFSDLGKDDVAGVSRVYQRVFPNDKPGSGGGGDPGQRAEIFVGFGQKLGFGERYELLMSALTSEPGVLSACIGGPRECNDTNGDWKTMTPLTSPLSSQQRFRLASVDMTEQLRLTVRFVPNGNGPVSYRSLAFERTGG